MKLARSELSRIIKEELDVVLKQKLHEDLSSLGLSPTDIAMYIMLASAPVWELIKAVKRGEFGKQDVNDFLRKVEDLPAEEVAKELEDHVASFDPDDPHDSRFYDPDAHTYEPPPGTDVHDSKWARHWREKHKWTQNLPLTRMARAIKKRVKDTLDADKTQAIKRAMDKIKGEEE
jgi:hypothetical protein